MSRVLFVGNLNVQVGDDELRHLFSQAGHVRTARVIRSPLSAHGTGNAFVEMCQEKEGSVAIALLNDREHRGQQLTVRVATFRDASDTARCESTDVTSLSS